MKLTCNPGHERILLLGIGSNCFGGESFVLFLHSFKQSLFHALILLKNIFIILDQSVKFALTKMFALTFERQEEVIGQLRLLALLAVGRAGLTDIRSRSFKVVRNLANTLSLQNCFGAHSVPLLGFQRRFHFNNYKI